MIYWLIGQPGCGKTTLAKRLSLYLRKLNQPVIHLDGDDLRKIFSVSYEKKENFTKEYRIEQTRALQKFIAHVANQGITVVVSTVNPYRDVREEFKNSRTDVKEFHIFTEEKRGRESFHVLDFENPIVNYTFIMTGGKFTEDESFNNLIAYL